MNAFLLHFLRPQLVKDLGFQVCDVGNPGVVGKNLEGSQVNSRSNLDTCDSLVIQPVRQTHSITLGCFAKEVLVRNVNVGILETLVIRQQVINRRAALTQDLLILQKTTHHNECLLEFGVGGSLAVNDLCGNFRCLLNGFHY